MIFPPPYMKYIIVDIDGTVADSRHRSHLLPFFKGKEVKRIADRGHGIVLESDECHYPDSKGIRVRWLDRGPIDEDGIWYRQNEFMPMVGVNWDDWHSGIAQDTPIQSTIYLLNAMRPKLLMDGAAFMFLSARWDKYIPQTGAWLKTQNLYLPDQGDLLVLRSVDDVRNDHDVKGELIDGFRAQGHEFICAFEDKRSVANMLRARGIPTLHVADY